MKGEARLPASSHSSLVIECKKTEDGQRRSGTAVKLLGRGIAIRPCVPLHSSIVRLPTSRLNSANDTLRRLASCPCSSTEVSAQTPHAMNCCGRYLPLNGPQVHNNAPFRAPRTCGSYSEPFRGREGPGNSLRMRMRMSYMAPDCQMLPIPKGYD